MNGITSRLVGHSEANAHAGHDAKAQSIISKALKAGAQPVAELEALLADLQSGTLTLAAPAKVAHSRAHMRHKWWNMLLPARTVG